MVCVVTISPTRPPPAATTASTAAGTSGTWNATWPQPGRSTWLPGMLVDRVVLEDLERRTVVAVARQAKVGASQVGVVQAGRGVEVGAPDVALGRDELAAEDVGVERGQSPPVVRR